MLDLKDIARCGVILAAIGAVSGGSIAATMSLTAPIIETRSKENLAASLRIVLPDADAFEEMSLEDGTVYYVATTAGKISGYVLKTVRAGYDAGVTVLTGVSEDGVVQGVEVTSHNETASIGGANVIKNKNFMEQFIGKVPGMSMVLNSDIMAISSATMTSKAVNNAVAAALDAFPKIIEAGK